MHGFISRDGTPPLDLLDASRRELKRYDTITLREAHVEAISGKARAFEVHTDDATYGAQRVLLATGVYDALPTIDGLREAWGHTAFVCPYCDGWEMRGKRIAVVGKGNKAVELAQELRQWTRDIVVCTQSEDSLSPDNVRWISAVGASHIAQPIRHIRSKAGHIESIEFEDGREERCQAMFLSAPLRPRYPLVDMLGCKLREDGEIDIDARGRTSVPGVYAAGDAVTTVHQVVLAAASGVCAAMAINEDCLKDEVRRSLA
jgi:thioredoxin reductase